MTILPWVPTILGILALVIGLVIAAVRLRPSDSAALPPPQPGFTLPVLTSGPQPPVSVQPAPPTTAAPRPAPTATVTSASYRPTPSRTPPPPKAVPVTGRYRVLNSYGDSFIAEVLIENTTSRPQDWTVVLAMPDDVGDLRTSWLESLPQPTLTQDGRRFTWRATVPLDARSKGALRFHFDRPGTKETPDSCRVDGSPCR